MGRLVTRQTILALFFFFFFSHLNLGACAGFALTNCDWLGRTIAFYQVFFHWFLYLLPSYFYDPGMSIFRWSSNFVEKVVLNESMSAKMASRVSYLVYYYCI